MKKNNIVIIFPRGEAIRNFVESGVIDNLQSNYNIYLYSVIPNEEFRNYLSSRCSRLTELQPIIESYWVRWFRQQLDFIHGRWLWSGAAKMRWALRDKEASNFKKIINRFFQKLLAYPFISRSGVELFSKWESKLSLRNVNPQLVKELQDINPVLVFNGSHIHCKLSYPLMYAAKKLELKRATFLFSWDNLTSQGRIIPNYHHYLVWNQSIKNDLLRIYQNVSESQVSVVGTSQFDFHFKKENIWTREDYCRKIGADPNRPIILYTTGMMNLMPYEEEIVLDIADKIKNIDSNPQLVVRVYPKDLSGRYETIKLKRTDIIFPDIPWEKKFLTPLPEDLPFLSNMLFHCEAGINVASTITLELAMFDRPIINIGYNPPKFDISPLNFKIYYSWDHYKPITDSGALDVVYEIQDIQQSIENALNFPENRKLKRKKLVETFFDGELDGKSYQRIVNTIKDIVEND